MTTQQSSVLSFSLLPKKQVNRDTQAWLTNKAKLQGKVQGLLQQLTGHLLVHGDKTLINALLDAQDSRIRSAMVTAVIKASAGVIVTDSGRDGAGHALYVKTKAKFQPFSLEAAAATVAEFPSWEKIHQENKAEAKRIREEKKAAKAAEKAEQEKAENAAANESANESANADVQAFHLSGALLELASEVKDAQSKQMLHLADQGLAAAFLAWHDAQMQAKAAPAKPSAKSKVAKRTGTNG